MRRLRWPYALPYSTREMLGWVNPTDEEVARLGPPAYEERVTSDYTEMFWGFEAPDGTRLDLTYHSPVRELQVISDPPDHAKAAAVLRALGIRSSLNPRIGSPVRAIERGEARYNVWCFLESGRTTAVFSRKALADAWIRKTAATGTLVPFPLDRTFPEGAPRGETYDYLSGAMVDGP